MYVSDVLAEEDEYPFILAVRRLSDPDALGLEGQPVLEPRFREDEDVNALVHEDLDDLLLLIRRPQRSYVKRRHFERDIFVCECPGVESLIMCICGLSGQVV